MRVRQASYFEVDEILEITKDYIRESGWKWTYCKDRSLEMLTTYIEGDETEIIYVEDNGKIAGIALVAFGYEFHPEPLGYIQSFYVVKDARGSGVGRLLADACISWFDHNKCITSFCSASANIKGQDKLFNNLMRKYGYEDAGQNLARTV